MTMQLIADESWDKVSPPLLKKMGYSAIIGYVSQDTTGKNLTAGNVADAHSAGLSVGIVYEFNPTSAGGGANNAVNDDAIAISHAKALGMPSRVALYHAADSDFTPGQLPSVYDYAMKSYELCTSAGFRHGMYGDFSVIAYLHGHGYPGFLWQTYAWSAGVWFDGATIRQVANGIHAAGGVFDKDTTDVADWGQWSPLPVVPVTKSVDVLTANWPIVKNGISGHYARVAEGLLVANGFPVGCDANHLDGDFGPVCESSTKSLQAKHGITVDGEFGPVTLSVALFWRNVI